MVDEPGAPEAARPAARALRPASTLMVVRDGAHPDAPLEVLMLRRNLLADFVGGAYVFPGGALDAADGSVAARCDGLDDAAASAMLRISSGGLAYWVAAVRECFEEAGLLFGRTRPEGPIVSFGDPAVAERFRVHRSELNTHRSTFGDVLAAEGILLAVDRLHYLAHWITPEGAPRRYDTRFFVALAPDDQIPAHDAGETVSDLWVRPHDALAAHRAGTMELILPTIRNLQAIGRFPTADQLLDAAATIEDVPAIEPRVRPSDEGITLLLPGDPGYDDAGRTGVGNQAGGHASADFVAAARLASRRANEQ